MRKAEMSEAAREARREYARRWRREHPDARREADIRYWENVARRRKEKEEADNG